MTNYTQLTEYRIRKSEDGIVKGYIGNFETHEEAKSALTVMAGDLQLRGDILEFEEDEIRYEYVIILTNIY